MHTYRSHFCFLLINVGFSYLFPAPKSEYVNLRLAFISLNIKLLLLKTQCFKFERKPIQIQFNKSFSVPVPSGRPFPGPCGGVQGRGRQETRHVSVPLTKLVSSEGFCTNKTPSAPGSYRQLLTRLYIIINKAGPSLSWESQLREYSVTIDTWTRDFEPY